MGFFDDLDDEVGAPVASGEADGDDDRWAPLIERLRGGWSFSETVTKPGQRDGEHLDDEVSLAFRDGRFVYRSRVVVRRGRAETAVLDPRGEVRRQLDEAGLRDLLGNQPLVGQRALAAATRG